MVCVMGVTTCSSVLGKSSDSEAASAAAAPIKYCASQISGASDHHQSFGSKRKELETSKSLAPPTSNNKDPIPVTLHRSISFTDWAKKSTIYEHKAAVKLQKVYKSFRTRRKLADCAVLVEQSWWKLLDFTELKESSISFFDVEKHETAVSRWSRARTRAAKVGKGLSKNSRAKKLALQHWLEAIDPRHRYGHNLHFYYVRWLQSQSREPFFYWLDLGEGKELNLVEKCPRSKLQQQCIKYLGPMERKAYEVELENGKFFKKQTREILDTTGGANGAKWIFVLSTSRVLYVGKKQKGTFQHSSFLAGGATLAAGQLVVENGILRAVWPHSGHYKPTEENFKDFILFLKEKNVDLTNVQTTPVDEEITSFHKQNSNMGMRVYSSEEHLTQTTTCFNAGQSSSEGLTELQANLVGDKNQNSPERMLRLTHLDIPTKHEFLKRLKSGEQVAVSDGYESPEEEAEEKDSLEAIHEKIIQRVNSRMELKSYQLGKQLSCTWSSGAGPRIGCVRDYPSELQKHALEMLSLSPRRNPGRGRSHSAKAPKPFEPLSHATSTPLDVLITQRGSPRSPTLPLPSPLWKANSLEVLSFL